MTNQDEYYNKIECQSSGLKSVFLTKDEKESQTAYNAWAANYEHELEGNYQAPQSLVDFVVKCLGPTQPKDIRILDVGAGTGLVAKGLAQHGYANIDAFDGSAKMLEIAKSRSLYKNYYQELLHTDKVSEMIEENAYDLVVGAGIFNAGHLSHRHMHHLIRAAKPGSGRIMFGISNTAFIIVEFREFIDKQIGKEPYNCELLNTAQMPFHSTFAAMDSSGTFYDLLKK